MNDISAQLQALTQLQMQATQPKLDFSFLPTRNSSGSISQQPIPNNKPYPLPLSSPPLLSVTGAGISEFSQPSQSLLSPLSSQLFFQLACNPL